MGTVILPVIGTVTNNSSPANSITVPVTLQTAVNYPITLYVAIVQNEVIGTAPSTSTQYFATPQTINSGTGPFNFTVTGVAGNFTVAAIAVDSSNCIGRHTVPFTIT